MQTLLDLSSPQNWDTVPGTRAEKLGGQNCKHVQFCAVVFCCSLCCGRTVETTVETTVQNYSTKLQYKTGQFYAEASF